MADHSGSLKNACSQDRLGAMEGEHFCALCVIIVLSIQIIGKKEGLVRRMMIDCWAVITVSVEIEYS